MSQTIDDLFKKYDIQDELGRGAFSVVKLGVNKQTGEKVAVKMIAKNKLQGSTEKNLRMETAILNKVNHPNIIALKDMIDTPDNLFLVMELVTGGELFDKIVEKGSYTEKEAAVVVVKILDAIGYLHKMGIAHRDLKPENLLLRDPTSDSEVKLADFGLSKIVGENQMMQTACGTPGYVAPEVLLAAGYGNEVDLWSIGVITYILLCGFPPFYNEHVNKLFEQIMAADYDFPEDYWSDISKEAKDFVSKLLVVDPKARLNCDQALNHPWLKTTRAQVLKSNNEKAKKFSLDRKESKSKIATANDSQFPGK